MTTPLSVMKEGIDGRRPTASTYLSLAIRTDDLSCLVVGGGRVGTRKAVAICRAGAKVTVLSPEITPRLQAMVDRGQIDGAGQIMPWVHGFRLVVAAADGALNRQIGRV